MPAFSLKRPVSTVAFRGYYQLDMAPSLGACKAICTITPGCKGVEYSHFGCEVWTREEGIGATAIVVGIECYRYVAFEAVDGGSDRACRGRDALDHSDNDLLRLNASTLDACQASCLTKPGCKGVSYSSAACELWLRPFGIQASVPEPGASCFRFAPWASREPQRLA